MSIQRSNHFSRKMRAGPGGVFAVAGLSGAWIAGAAFVGGRQRQDDLEHGQQQSHDCRSSAS